MKLYYTIRDLLDKIEETLPENPTVETLSESLFISPVHLQRLFKSAFEITLARYIRSRRLATSLEKLFNTELGISDIAVEHGFEHAQSYIRAFKNEFGLTPGEARKTRQIVKIKPPIQLFPSNALSGGLLFGPEIVYIPRIYCVGKRHQIPFNSGAALPANTARKFWLEDKNKIPNIINPAVFIGLTTIGDDSGGTTYLTSVCAPDLSDIPPGFSGCAIPACICVRFRYIGQHHFLELDADVAGGMYDAVGAFINDKEAKYTIYGQPLHFERIAEADYDGTYCKMEWFSPVREK